MDNPNVIKGENVKIDPTSSINNTILGDNVKIAKYCSVFGSDSYKLKIGKNSYVGMMSILNGFNNQLIIGNYVSIAQNVNIMTDSGPNASILLQRIFPLIKGRIEIGDHTWIGGNVIIMPNVVLGKFCIVGANSFVNKSFPDYSIIGGTPAKLIRKLSRNELKLLKKNDKIS